MRFIKIESLGNDFILLDWRNHTKNFELTKSLILKLCDRHCGIGADGVLLLTSSSFSTLILTIFNADGSEAAMCGNGLRCVAAYLYATNKLKEARVTTKAGSFLTQVTDDGKLIVEMPAAEIIADNLKASLPQSELTVRSIDKVYHVTVGVPHVVVLLKPNAELATDWAVELWQFWTQHPCFPEGTNLDLVVPVEKHLTVLTYERGVGLTAACGTGATAVAAVWFLQHPDLSEVTISFKLGNFTLLKALSSRYLRFCGTLPRIVFSGEFL